jgi:hypothetical protein
MAKTEKESVGEAVSTKNQESVQNAKQALVITGDGDVSGPLMLALSQTKQDELILAFQEALHQVQEGFGELAKPRDLCAQGLPFNVIDAITIDDFEDRRNGEILTKHLFKLQFEDNRIAWVMQSDARPRKIMAQTFTRARALQMRLRAGPYKFAPKVIPGQPEPAQILVQQPGFYAGPA